MTRPVDTWRVCGQPVTVPERLDQRGRGCTCSSYALFDDNTLLAALARLAPSADDPPTTAPRP